METAQLHALLQRVFDRMACSGSGIENDHMDIQQWEWPQGVALYGLMKYYGASREQKYFDFIQEWYEQRIAGREVKKNVNTAAPLLGLACLYEVTKKQEHFLLCSEWAEWIMKEMPRTEENGLQHVTTHLVNEQQLWDDTLFMAVLFLAKFGILAQREDYVQEAVYQFLLHMKYLSDTETGLWFHGWTFDGRNNFGRALWARGNCWFTAGVVDFIEITGIEGAVKRYLLNMLQIQVKKLAELQHPGGMWHTLLKEPSSYLEASATAGFGYGILKAVRKGYIAVEYLDTGKKALDAVIQHIGQDGTVGQVSYGTALGMDDEHYKNIPLCPTSYGQALTIMLLTEAVQL